MPIGRALDNGCAYIVDHNEQLVPDGLPGELWIGGDTVARDCHEPLVSRELFDRVQGLLTVRQRTPVRTLPENMFVPDLVMALAIIPAERPCVASKRLVSSSNSAIESRLKRG